MKVDFPIQNLNIGAGIKNEAALKDKVPFMDFLNNAIQETNRLQLESERLNEAFAMGKKDNLHQVMIAAEKADIALQFTIQIRNKILEAYQEIMRMPV